MGFGGFVNEMIIDTTVDDFWAEIGGEPAVAEVEGELAAAAEVDGEPAAVAELDGEPAIPAMDDVPKLDGEIQ
ncbi:unnamed protein product [Cuscuta europaea]|uniref:Uncharacterized protein n=1 Tax=Cuscuta europaea TaxID=41803 RepID=A0A9P0YZJ3_CUSEU|nr:unnamed protein product [Cuscuta europaea]